MQIRAYAPDDLDAAVAINDAAYPAVPITPRDELAALIELASLALVVDDGGEPVGFLIVLEPGLDYASENYRWFSRRSSSWVYVDRIVLDERTRGQGLGRSLYEAVFELARTTGADEVICEVNIEPPNPASLAFHARLGFVEVGQQSTKSGTTVVSLLAAPVEGVA